MTGYTRQSSANMVTGNTMYASDFNNEFNAIQSAFDGSTGHSHDGTTGNGPKINLTTSVSGILPVANGGSGGINNFSATTAPTASDDSNAGYRVGSLWVDTTNDIAYICLDATVATAVWMRLSAYSAALASIAGLTTSANQTIYTTGSNLYATTSLTAFGRSLIDDVDAATARGTLGLGTIATQAANNIAVTGGTMSSVNITGGTISSIIDLAIADGGTGASTAAGARTNLGLVIGTDVQAQDAELSAIAGLTSAANKLPYFTGSGTAALADFTAAGRALVDDADAAAQRTTLGLGNVDNTSDANKPVSTATAAAIATATDQYAPRGYISGLITQNNLTDPNNDINIQIGECATQNLTTPVMMKLTSGITKRLDAAWAVGSGNGGLDTGTVGTNTTYHIYIIRRPDTGVVDALFSLSATSPTLPANYTQYRRIMSIIRGTNNYLYTQRGDFIDLDPANVVSLRNSTAAAAGGNISANTPSGIIVQPRLYSVQQMSSTGNIQTFFTTPGWSNSSRITTIDSQEVGQYFSDAGGIFTNSSGQIYYECQILSGSLGFNVLQLRGWIDDRGKGNY